MTYVAPRTVLCVDLTTQTSRRFDLDDSTLARVLGGVGLAVELLHAYLVESDLTAIDPLGPKNPLVFAAGPFASTPVPAANEHALATISPLTGLLNEGLSSSHWSAVLRRCGLAALVITGAADAWTLLVVEGERVRFESADDLLGLSAREATKAVRDRLVDRTTRVCSIGRAGERGVRYASVENDGRQAGRGGMGAVFGSKRLKAVALRGRGEVRIADPAATAIVAERLRERAFGPATAKYRIRGAGASMRVLERMGRLPTRNFRAGTFAGIESVTPDFAREHRGDYLELRAGCAGCPVQCEHMYVRKDRDRRSAGASDYESVWAFGPNCGIDSLDAVLDAIVLCDRDGLDPISTGGTIAFAMECVERGLIAEDGLGTPLRFGNAAALVPAIEAIVAGTGIGALLALGVRAAAARIGGDAPTFAMHAKGLELPGYEPRALPTYALGLATGTRGACHTRAATDDADLRDPGAATDPQARARAAIRAEDDAIVWDSLVLCTFVRDCFVDFYTEAADLWTAVTGLTLTADDLQRSAAATWKAKRAINARLGWTPAADRLPERLLAEPIGDGILAGMRLDRRELATMQAHYERQRHAQHGLQSVETRTARA